MYVLNFAKASPYSTAVIRLLRRRGVFFNKRKFLLECSVKDSDR